MNVPKEDGIPLAYMEHPGDCAEVGVTGDPDGSGKVKLLIGGNRIDEATFYLYAFSHRASGTQPFTITVTS